MLINCVIGILVAGFAGCSGGGSSPATANAQPGPTATATAAPSAAPGGAASPVAPATPSAAPTQVGAVPSSVPSSNPPQLGELPIPADRLADSIGINTHVPNAFSAPDFPTVVSRLQTLGVRHIRDGIVNSDPPYDAAMLTLLQSTGATLDGVTDCPGIEYNSTTPTSAASIQSFDAAIGNRLEAVEAPNEVDGRNDSNWAADTRSCLPSLRAAEPQLPFIAPSIRNTGNGSMLGDISAGVDYGNVHRYFSGRNPGTSGWGGTYACGTYGALSWALCEAAIMTGTKPVLITETGYGSGSETNETTQGKYLSRVFFVNMLAGVPRTFVYDLKDYPGQNNFGDYGLLRMDDSEKPAFSAIANEISLFSDRGQTVSPKRLLYAVAASSAIKHMLFQKSDGTYMLALWNESSSWDPNAKTSMVVPPQSVTIALQTTPNSAGAVALDDSAALVSKPLTTSGAALTLSVDDHMTFLHFKAP